MQLELEAKFYPIDKEAIIQKLKLLGAINTSPERLMRRAVYDQSVNPSINCTYARVRDEGDKVTMSLKVNAPGGGTIYDQKESQVIINSFESGREILAGLGLKETGYQENKRSTWKYLNSEIVVDEWPALLPYLEIEGPTESEIRTIAERLGMDWATKTFVSTDGLYAKQYGITDKEALGLLSNITFENIPVAFSKK